MLCWYARVARYARVVPCLQASELRSRPPGVAQCLIGVSIWPEIVPYWVASETTTGSPLLPGWDPRETGPAPQNAIEGTHETGLVGYILRKMDPVGTCAAH